MSKDYVLLCGGLGNQLYQLSFANFLSKERSKRPILFYVATDTGDTKDRSRRNIFQEMVPELGFRVMRVHPRINRLLDRVLRRASVIVPWARCVDEPERSQAIFLPEPVKSNVCGGKRKPGVSIHRGYYQSHHYLDPDFIAKIYEVLSRRVVKPIIQVGARDVAIHLRRGDFLNFQQIFRCFTEQHYLRGLSILEEEAPIGKVYVFSDDFEAIASELDVISAKYEVVKVYGNSVVQDIVQMAQFSRFVLANSTFSWWAAFMAESRTAVRVVVPERPLHWHQAQDSYYPIHWIKI